MCKSRSGVPPPDLSDAGATSARPPCVSLHPVLFSLLAGWLAGWRTLSKTARPLTRDPLSALKSL